MTIIRNTCSKNLATPLALGLLLLPAILFAQSSDPESVARNNWRSTMKHMPAPHKGCFHATYPNLVWESVACEQESPNARPMHVTPKSDSIQGDAAKVDSAQGGAPEIAGNGNDYVASTRGLINHAEGDFESASVQSESSVGVAAYGNGGILGPNEYSLQINTNANATTAACKGRSGCKVWQQFVYATDYYAKGRAAVFIQYWLLGWGFGCPSTWHAAGADCWKNGNLAIAPNIPATQLGPNDDPYLQLNPVELNAEVTAGGEDSVELLYGTGAYLATGEDSVLDIGTVWNQAEFNVFGDGGGSEAVFNLGANLEVLLFVDTSGAPVTCLGPAYAGTTGDSSDLILGSCAANNSYGYGGSIEFTEAFFATIFR